MWPCCWRGGVRAFVLALACVLLSAAHAASPPAHGASLTAADRWVEIDLYGFDAQSPERSAVEFWDRYQPLYRGISGYRGVVLNIGFTVNYVMGFCKLDQAIGIAELDWPGNRGQGGRGAAG